MIRYKEIHSAEEMEELEEGAIAIAKDGSAYWKIGASKGRTKYPWMDAGCDWCDASMIELPATVFISETPALSFGTPS